MNDNDKMLVVLQNVFGVSMDKEGFICPICKQGSRGYGVRYKERHGGFHCYGCTKTETGIDWLYKYMEVKE